MTSFVFFFVRSFVPDVDITCVRLSVLDPEQSGVQSVTSGVFLDQSATLWPK